MVGGNEGQETQIPANTRDEEPKTLWRMKYEKPTDERQNAKSDSEFKDNDRREARDRVRNIQRRTVSREETGKQTKEGISEREDHASSWRSECEDKGGREAWTRGRNTKQRSVCRPGTGKQTGEGTLEDEGQSNPRPSARHKSEDNDTEYNGEEARQGIRDSRKATKEEQW